MDELSEIRQQAVRALAAEPRLVVVVGDVGMGKTTLIDQSLASLDQLHVLRGSGEESETDIPFALLGQLFGDRSPAATGTSGEPFAVGAGILQTLDELQDTGPLALVVDDAHWVDDMSMRSLLFAMRRLRADRVLVVLAVRTEQEHLLPAGITRHLQVSGRRLPLPGLSMSEVAELVSASGAAGLPRWALRRLWEHTRGNPLWVRALVEELEVNQLAAPDLDLPAPAAFANGVRRRADNCSAETRSLVAAASVMGGTTPLGILARVADLGDAFAALDEAQRAGLLTRRSAPPSVLVSFPHPLISAAIYHDLDIAPRNALHRRAATVVEDEAARIRHQVAACTASDEGLARRVNEHALSRRAGGAFDSAAAAFRTAAQLTPRPEIREALLLEAAETWLMAGRASEARGVLSMLPRQDESPRRNLLGGWLALSVGQVQEAERALARAWNQSAPEDIRVRVGAARILAQV